MQARALPGSPHALRSCGTKPVTYLRNERHDSLLFVHIRTISLNRLYKTLQRLSLHQCVSRHSLYIGRIVMCRSSNFHQR